MGNMLKVIDVVNLGIEKEITRRDFYGQVAKAFDEEELSALFHRLRDWEDGHIQKFKGIRKSVENRKLVESYPGEMTRYMETLVDESLYTGISGKSFAKTITHPLEAIDRGIQFEKDAILFFMELLPYIQESDKSAIMEMVFEERRHMLYLIGLKRKYSR